MGIELFYFKFNIGDYASHTQHLTLIEDIAYRRMLEAYYLQERPLNAGVAAVARQIRMREHEKEVGEVLREFFNLTEDGWQHNRVDQEIVDYRNKIEQASRAGKASAERRSNGRSTDVQRTFNQPITNNQEPINQEPVTKNTPRKSASPSIPDGVSESLWADFLSIRKAKRSPLTATALAGIEREALKAGISLSDAISACCEFGWQAFNAGWYADRQKKANPTDVARTTAPGPVGPDPELQRLIEQRAMAAKPPPEIMAKIKEWTQR